jgi:hypothetical protein
MNKRNHKNDRSRKHHHETPKINAGISPLKRVASQKARKPAHHHQPIQSPTAQKKDNQKHPQKKTPSSNKTKNTHLLPIPNRIPNSQHPIPNRTRAQMMQHHMTRNGQHAPVVRHPRHVRRVDRDRARA